jgi:hypothetical protein
MTQIENSVDEALGDLKTMRGALLVVETSNEEDAGDYFGLCGQKEAIIDIVKKQYETLDRVIESLEKVAPKDGVGGREA